MRNGKSDRSKKQKTRSDSQDVVASSGNIFVDLELPNPHLALAKAELVFRIRALITQRKLTQAGAGELLRLDQPKVSALMRGRVQGYSIDRLFRYLNALGQQVEITVRPAQPRQSGSPGILVIH